jgi:hypothetical protein
MIELAIGCPQDVPTGILKELEINPAAGRLEGLLDASVGERLVNLIQATKT